MVNSPPTLCGSVHAMRITALILCALASLASGLARAQAIHGSGQLGLSLSADDYARKARKGEDLDRPPVRLLPESVPVMEISEAAWEELTAFWEDFTRDCHLPGAAIGLLEATGDERMLCLGLRNARQPELVDDETLFNLGPATLAVTTLMAASGDQPDDPVFARRAETISPLFRLTDPRASAQCEVRNLLSMTAGVPSYSDAILDPLWSRPEDAFAALGQAPIMSPPGQRYQPSRLSAAVGGYLAAMHLGNSRRNLTTNYENMMAQRVFIPLNMDQAVFSEQAAKATGNRASSHARAEYGYNPIFPDRPDVHPLAPAVGLKINLHDALRWLHAELHPGLAPGNQRMAPAVSVRERWQPIAAQDTGHFGLGWQRRFHDGVEIIHATGKHDGQCASVGFFPAYRAGYVALVNTSSDDALALLDAVQLGLAETLRQSRRQPPTPSVAAGE